MLPNGALGQVAAVVRRRGGVGVRGVPGAGVRDRLLPAAQPVAVMGMPSVPWFSVGVLPAAPRMTIIGNGLRVCRCADALPVPSSSRVHMPSRQSKDV